MIGGAKGIGLGLDFGIGNQLRPRNSKPYIEQAVLDSLCGVWIADQNTNESPNRNIIKNKLKDRGGDFEILNAAYKDNSGYGLYKEDFSKWLSVEGVEVIYNKIRVIQPISQWIIIRNNETVNSIKVKISNLKNGIRLRYRYNDNGTLRDILISNGEWTLPASLGWQQGHGFLKENSSDNITGVVIEQIPDHKGAFVTDGVDDLIVSQKPVSEMLGGSNEITVVSMIHQQSKTDWMVTNIIRKDADNYIRNRISENSKTGIYGYSLNDSNSSSLINNILGDKNDYSIEFTKSDVIAGKFSVVGILREDNTILFNSSVAYYWAFIANKVLTEDQINQVIEYFNLDKYVAPDVLYNVKRQGITNDNHAEFGDKLIDYSGNGHDMQLYNIGWSLNSGVGKYNEDFVNEWSHYEGVLVSNDKIRLTEFALKDAVWIADKIVNNKASSFFVNIKGIPERGTLIISNPWTELHNGLNKIILDGISSNYIGLRVVTTDGLDWSNLVIEQVPENEGALVLDGVNDYGKVTNLPIYKDYTVVADREILQTGKSGCSISKNNPGAFLFELGAATSSSNTIAEYSFGMVTPLTVTNERQFSYQSKYLYNGEIISAGTDNDTKDMWLGTVRDNDPRFSNLAFYSAMLFPYSLSKFLIERQLKRHKLGSLYGEEDILFRPEISSNIRYKSLKFYRDIRNHPLVEILPGEYFNWLGYDKAIRAVIEPYGIDEPATIIVNGETVTFNRDYKQEGEFYVPLNTYSAQIFPTKSPQKINITIKERVRFEDMPQFYPAYVTYTNLKNEDTFNWYNHPKKGDIKINNITNLLPDLYEIIDYNVRVNGEWKSYTKDELLKESFNTETIESGYATVRYLLDNNEPKCILSPKLLDIPNESYKYLGCIPDISGHGNHGFFNNVGFTDVSGADRNGIIHLDGVDDFISFRSMLSGKQMFMKFSWTNTAASIAYDQRSAIDLSNSFALLAGKDVNVSYSQRNADKTYINGIENKYITNDELIDLVHNVLLVNENTTTGEIPIIGKNKIYNGYNTKMSLYTFMLFDEISTPEKIRELNEIIGINPIIETPPYYYDTYGKSNEDTNKAELTNLGNGGEHTLNIQNVGYEGMSGYGGYPIVFGNNKTWVTFPNLSNGYIAKYTNNIISIEQINTKFALQNSYIKQNGVLTSHNVEIPSWKISVSGIKGEHNVKLIYSYLATDDATNISNMEITEDGVYELPKSCKGADKLIYDNIWVGLWFTANNDIVSCNITIEVLPDYPNGLLLDGVNDTLRNATIPALTDFTCVVKREPIGEQSGNSIFAFKGATTSSGGKRNAFLYDYISVGKNNVYSFGQANGVTSNSPISYITRTLCDDKVITSGDGEDNVGLIIGKWDTWWKGVFYKLILYPKTLDLLQIRMLKNLFELDEKIDINNPIFKGINIQRYT